jgi:hypothetical protein
MFGYTLDPMPKFGDRGILTQTLTVKKKGGVKKAI